MNLQRTINYHSFSDGDKLCNKLKEGDCVVVSGGLIHINMDGEPKIYIRE